jgi:hypothetical protein
MFTRVIQDKPPRRRLLALFALGAVGAALFVAALVAVAAPPPQFSANIDQCRNGGIGKAIQQCTGSGSGNSGWVNGNAGASNSHYAEGESISYRARLSGFAVGDQVRVVLGYDVIHNQHYSIDYLTDKNGWQTPETTVALTPDLPTGVSPVPAHTLINITTPPGSVNADPTKSFAAGCVGGATGSPQPLTSYNANLAAGREVMELFGGTSGTMSYVGTTPTFTAVGGGDQEQQVAVTFTATSSNVVLAWGGHIASRLDWGCTDGPLSAGGISGSPYHMRLKQLFVNSVETGQGNQDRSLSAAAVIVPPLVDVTKTVNKPNVCSDANNSVTYTYVVTNQSTTAEVITISDDKLAGAQAAFNAANGNSSTLAAGGSVTFTLNATITVDTTNTVTVTAAANGFTATDTATASVDAHTCAIAVTKSAAPSPICNDASTTVTFSYTVSNPGDVDLTGVTVSDNQVTGAQAAFQAANPNTVKDTLTPGQSVSFTLTKVLSGSQTNTITASGSSLGVTETKTASATVTGVACGIDVTKSAAPATICAGLDTTVTFSYSVKNTGGAVMTGVTVSDDQVTGAQAAFEAANPNAVKTTLNAGQTVSFTLTKSLSADQTNTITASGSSLGVTSTDTASASVDAVKCEITVTKSAEPSVVCNGANTTVTFSYTVKNTGDVDLTGVTVSDDQVTGAQAAFQAANPNTVKDTLTPGQTVSFTLTQSLGASQTNTITASGNALGHSPADTDTASATVTGVACGIDVTKSAAPATICAGLDTTVTFSYSVKNTGGAVMTGVTVSDDQVTGAQAAFEAANPNAVKTTLNAGQTVSFTLTKSLSADQTNTITASGSSLGVTSTDTASASVDAVKCEITVTKSAAPTSICNGQNTTVTFSYTVKNTGDVDLTGVTVSDNQVTGAQAAFQAANPNTVKDTLTPGQSVSFTLTKVLSASQTNTITASGNALGHSPADTDTASATVTARSCETSQLVPTQTTCATFVAGVASEDTIFYGVKNGVINNVSPGVLFYYTSVTAPSTGSLTFTITQTNDQPGFPLFGIQSVSVFNADCSSRTATVSTVNGVTTITINGVTAGQTFYANIKIDPGTVKNHVPPSPAILHFTYTTKIGATTVTSASGTLRPKP